MFDISEMEEMKVSEEVPPNYQELLVAFPSIVRERPIFCYGDTIYNPFKKNIPADLVFHEAVHSKQQGNTPEIWWMRYIQDEQFRLEQEFEAYGEQYAFIARHIGNNRIKKQYLESMSTALSGEVYGRLLSYGEAESKIKRYAKAKQNS